MVRVDYLCEVLWRVLDFSAGSAGAAVNSIVGIPLKNQPAIDDVVDATTGTSTCCTRCGECAQAPLHSGVLSNIKRYHCMCLCDVAVPGVELRCLT